MNLIVLATEEGEASGIKLLIPETAELIWGLVGFSLLMAFMWRIAFPRMTALLDERSAKIQGQLEQAESTRQEAEGLKRQYAEQLANAREESNRIIEEARKDAERIRTDKLAEAEEEADGIRARAREEAEGARSRVVADLRQQVAVASVELAGKIVQRELDPARHRELVDQYINELSGLN